MSSFFREASAELLRTAAEIGTTGFDSILVDDAADFATSRNPSARTVAGRAVGEGIQRRTPVTSPSTIPSRKRSHDHWREIRQRVRRARLDAQRARLRHGVFPLRLLS